MGGPNFKDLSRQDGHPLYASRPGRPSGAVERPDEINGVEECLVGNNGRLDSGYKEPCLLTVDSPNSRFYCEPSNGTPSHEHLNGDTQWQSVLASTDNLSHERPVSADQVAVVPHNTCRVGRDVYLFRDHERLGQRYDPATGGNFTPVFTGLTAREADRIGGKLQAGQWKATAGDRDNGYRRDLYLLSGQFHPAMLDLMSPVADWLAERGGFSEGGCDVVSWYNPISWAPALFTGEDDRACELYASLDHYLDPLRKNRSAFSFQTILTVGATIGGAFLSAYALVADLRRSVNDRVRSVFRNGVNSVRRLAGKEEVRSNPMTDLARRLSPTMDNLSELAREYLRDPEAFRRDHPKGIPSLAVAWPDPPGSLEDDIDREDVLKVKGAMLNRKNASATLVGPQGDGKTYTALKAILYAARGDLGPELEATDFWSMRQKIWDGQTDQTFSRLYDGGTIRFATAISTAASESFENGRRVAIFWDQIEEMNRAGYRYDSTLRRVLNPSAAQAFLTETAGGQAISFLGTSITSDYEKAIQAQSDFFGEGGRVQRIDRTPKTAEQVMAVLRAGRDCLQQETGATISDDVLREVERLSYEKMGLHNPRAAENELNMLVRRAMDAAAASGNPVDLNPAEIRRMADQQADLRLDRILTDAFAGEDLQPARPGELEDTLFRKVVAETHPDFSQWEREVQQRLIGRVVSVWQSQANVRERFQRIDPRRAFELFVRRVVQNVKVQEELQQGQLRFETLREVRAASAPQPTGPAAPQGRPPVVRTGWEEVLTRRVSPRAINAALLGVDPELARFFREAAVSSGSSLRTVGDLLQVVEAAHPGAADAALALVTGRGRTLTRSVHEAVFELVAVAAEARGRWADGDATRRVEMATRFARGVRAAEREERGTGRPAAGREREERRRETNGARRPGRGNGRTGARPVK